MFLTTDITWYLKRELSLFYFRNIKKRIPNEILDSSILFIHIPKAAGLSISHSLYNKEISHRRYKDYQIADELKLRNLFKFSITRHPIDRFISAYCFLSLGGLKRYKNDLRFSRFLNSYTMEKFILEWISDFNVNRYIHFIPQYKFLNNTSEVIDLDFLGKVENIKEDIRVVEKATNRKIELIHINKTKKQSYTNTINPKSDAYRHLIQIYKKDFDLFNY